MNKQTQIAWEFRISCVARANSLNALNHHYDYCKGFAFALLVAEVISDSEFDQMGVHLNAVNLQVMDRLFGFKSAAESVYEGSESVSSPAASGELPVRLLRVRTPFYVITHKLHPKWFPETIALGGAQRQVPSSWPPLPGKRSLVCGEGQVRLPSFQASA